ncbi:Uma2 family endonuclease [Leptolyngbya sp. 15MV]|nr:Uma2 family endonuclease [Leptolyngbya sp. 15MV]
MPASSASAPTPCWSRRRCRACGCAWPRCCLEPEPDVALVRRRPDRYRTAHPDPADVLLLIEVKKTSLASGCGSKARFYAGARHRRILVLDLEGRRLERFRDPRPDGYSRIEALPCDADVEPQALPGFRLSRSDSLT